MFNILKKNIDNAEFNIIIPSLLRWVDNLAQIDSEAFEWIKFSLEHIHKRYEIGFFLEAIILHIPKQAKEVGNIILIFSENTKVILYRTDEVEKILQALFDNGEKDVLHDVLNNFGRNGHLQFGDLYKKYFPINK